MTKPYWASDDGDVTLHLGDCLDVLRTLEADSIDAIVTDPPAGIAFMGRDWDDFRRARWRFTDWLAERMSEALRVLKPGGHLLVWSLPRTSHWTAWALEDAGLEIRDCILHLFGSGFPKSLDVSKAIDKAAGAEREVVGRYKHPGRNDDWSSYPSCSEAKPSKDAYGDFAGRVMDITAPATEDAARWEGWGTALKPGQEIWWLARKPLKGTVAANVLEFGTGALNIDGCRAEGVPPSVPQWQSAGSNNNWAADGRNGAMSQPNEAGRWPANVVFTHSAACQPTGIRNVASNARARKVPAGADKFPGAYGALVNDIDRPYGTPGEPETVQAWDCAPDCPVGELDRQSGASRFYPTFRYQAKAPASERPRLEDGTAHETVKPLGLMTWLVRLITPPGGTVLDLFAGSGPVAEACIIEGFRCVLIEQDPKSAALIRKRLSKPIQPVMFGLEG